MNYDEYRETEEQGRDSLKYAGDSEVLPLPPPYMKMIKNNLKKAGLYKETNEQITKR